MKRYYKLFLTFILSIACFTPFLLKNVNAATTDVSLPYQEPSTSDNQGYISVLFENNSSGKLFVMTWIWNITNESASGGNSGMQIYVTDTSVKFVSQLPTGEKGYSLIYSYNSGGNNITVNQYKYFTTTCEEYKYTTTSYTIRGFQAKGNVKYLVDEVSSPSAFAIRWGDDKLLTNKLDSLIDTIESLGITDSSILSEIETISGDLATIKTKINSIYTKVATIDTNVLNIYNQMVTVNDWLESIRDGISLSNGYLIEIRNILSEKLEYIGERLRIANTHLVDIKNVVIDTYNYLIDELDLHLGRIIDRLDSLIDTGHDVNNEDTDTLQDKLQNNVSDYDDIESGLVDDFETNLGDINLDNDLFAQSDFVKTGVFISTQMTRIYESNDIVRMMLTFGMIIGLAFTIIGISVKR